MSDTTMNFWAIQSEVDSIVRLMDDFTVETTPASAAKVNNFQEILQPGATVYITFLPGTDYRSTVDVARRIRLEGFEPAPHIPARSITDKAMLEDFVARAVGEADVDHVLTIAGAVDAPIGDFADSMQVLETGILDKYGIKQIGVAGHPEGSPDISDDDIAAALAWKNGFAERTDASMHILTQFCFEAEPLIAWDKALNADGNKLPIRVGVPGIAKLSTLLKYGMACGIGNSIQFIKKQAKNVTKLIKVQSPDILVRDLARYAALDDTCGIDGLHVYPLGGLKKSAEWSYAVAGGAISLTDKGFDVDRQLN